MIISIDAAKVFDNIQHPFMIETLQKVGIEGSYLNIKKPYKNKPKTIQKMVIGTSISIITLKVNGLNAPTNRHTLAEWIQKQDLYMCCLQETHFRPRDTYRLKVRGWKKIFHTHGNQKKAEEAILISDKIDFKIKTITITNTKQLRKWQ